MKPVHLGTTLLLVQLTLACSVGTEVGNGVKPSDPSPPQTATNASGVGPAAPDNAVNTSTTATVAASPAPGVPISAAVAAGAVGSASVFNPAMERIFANCASPFGSGNIASPVVLSHKNISTRDNKISASFTSGTQTWKISDANATLYRQLVLDPSHGAQAVVAYDAGFQALSSSLTCGSLTTDTAATVAGSSTVYTKLSVNLTDATGQVFSLSWYLQTPGGGAPLQLQRIEIGTGANAAPFVLESE